jgi:hypothetical protein
MLLLLLYFCCIVITVQPEEQVLGWTGRKVSYTHPEIPLGPHNAVFIHALGNIVIYWLTYFMSLYCYLSLLS